MADARIDLIGLSREELVQAFAEIGEKPFRAKQLWRWLYVSGETDFERMSSFSRPLQKLMEERFVVRRPKVERDLASEDGSRKWLLQFEDGRSAEMVFIPDDERAALCVSSQVGCMLTCQFCHTGTQKFERNITAPEILGQVMLARDACDEWPKPTERRLFSNIVMMGQGEPLFNFDNVAKALKIVLDNEGLAFSRRRVTLSTSGVVPMIARCGDEIGCDLAVSLHAATDELRDRLVPINRRWPIAELMRACRAYPGVHNARRITFEYVMLKGVNDSPADARRLAALVRGIPAKFNLIPFNKWPGAPFECSTPQTMTRFADILAEEGYTAPIRTPRGRDIMAACGQLKTAAGAGFPAA